MLDHFTVTGRERETKQSNQVVIMNVFGENENPEETSRPIHTSVESSAVGDVTKGSLSRSPNRLIEQPQLHNPVNVVEKMFGGTEQRHTDGSSILTDKMPSCLMENDKKQYKFLIWKSRWTKAPIIQLTRPSCNKIMLSKSAILRIIAE